MKKTLLVTNSEQSAAALSKLFEEEGYKDITVSYAAYSAEQQEEEFDLVCINAPLADENGIALATRFANTTRASVVIIVPITTICCSRTASEAAFSEWSRRTTSSSTWLRISKSLTAPRYCSSPVLT